MIEIIVPPIRDFNEETGCMVTHPGGTLLFEHSLKSISKWESKFCKPYLHMDKFTTEEAIYYINCMLVKKAPQILVDYFMMNMPDELGHLWEYVNKSQTATWFKDQEGSSRHPNDIITSERLYYWMSALQINWEAQYWHISRLLAVIRVGQEENKPKKKMKQKDVMAQHTSLNKARRAAAAAKKR